MESENNIQNTIQQIINKNIKIINNSSAKTSDTIDKSKKTYFESFQTKILNVKNILLFNYFNWNPSGNIIQPNIFHHHSDLSNSKCQKAIESLFYFSYRKNFASITNAKKKTKYSSDARWGCMIRSSQMILAKAIYLQFKYQLKLNNTTKTKEELKYLVLIYFIELPLIKLKNFCPTMFALYFSSHSMQYYSEDFITEIIPPFSIQTICSIGELFNKSAGEWFSDVVMPKIFSLINTHFKIISNWSLMHFDSLIKHQTIIDECFTEIMSTDPDYDKKNCFIITVNKKSFQFKQSGILFVSVRIGYDSIPKEYYNSIKALFNLKECIGIIGGEGSYGYYFIGYSEKNQLLYLNPHLVQECIKELNIETYQINEINQMNFNQMQNVFTIGFQFRTFTEYIELIKFFQEESLWEFPVFSYSDLTSNKIEQKKETIQCAENDSNENDF